MSVPVVDPESSVLSYPQWLTWEHQFSATNTPYDWAIVAGGFPTGMTFQPSLTATGATSGNVFTATAHGLLNGTAIVFRSLTGGSGTPAANTIYYIISETANTFQLAATPGGVALALGSTVTASLLYRPGYLLGPANTPGISTVQLTAINGTGPSTPASLWTIGIEPAAVSPDSNCDVVWNFATNDIIAQTDATLNLVPLPRTTPILFVKEQDDLIVRLRLVKAGSVLDLGALPSGSSLQLVLKELETSTQVVVSDGAVYIGSGDATSYLVHAKFNGALLAASLSNYENDAGTFYGALAEFELTFVNQFPAVGTTNSVRTSKTFTIEIERDLGEA